MSKQTYPINSNKAVNKAGDAVRDGKQTEGHVAVIENWRESHAYILNTFQANLRKRTKDKKIIFAQRHKRRNTIYNKLQREPKMSLSRMHDIAGCRLIFEGYRDLEKFRSDFHKARFRHKRKTTKYSDDPYNYIINPKFSGYRGIHDVYEYVGSTSNNKWDGLKIEVQYRTKYQHAWSTAVEIVGYLTENQPKFSQGNDKYLEFFKLASEIIARAHESSKSCYASLSNKELLEKFSVIDKELKLIKTLRSLNRVTENFSKMPMDDGIKNNAYCNVILVFSSKENGLTAYAYKTEKEALAHYFELEKTGAKEDDIVLVMGENNESIKNAFKNYFSDAKDFVTYITEGRVRLSGD